MKTQSTRTTGTEVINSAIAKTTGANLEKSRISQVQPARLEDVEVQMTRILDTLTDRTTKILRFLGIDIGGFRASWRPLDGIEGLAEKLAHVEITPEVKANALTNDK